MKMSQSFKLIILLAVASLALSAPTGNVENAKETLVVKDTEVKTDVNDKDSIAVVPNEKIVDDKMENTKKEASAIDEVKDKVQFIEPVDKKEETKENIETVSEVKDVADKNELSDEKNSVVKSEVLETKTPEKKEEKVEITPTDMKTVLKMADEVIKKTDKLVVDVKESIKYSDDPLKEVDSKLRDVASAVAEAVTNLPLPGKPERPENNKFTQVFGMFVNELMTVPMVILHAISNAISSLTGGTKPIAVAAASS